MQINRVQAPNFGNLVITKAAEEHVAQCGPELLGKIDAAGKKLNGTKMFNVVLGDNLECRIVSVADAVFAPFKNNKHVAVNGDTKNILIMDGQYGVFKFLDKENPRIAQYNIWAAEENAAKTYAHVEDIDVIADIAKTLDTVAVNNEQQRIKNIALILYKYGAK